MTKPAEVSIPATAALKSLKKRVQELEEILASIKKGNIDALVIFNDLGKPSILTLEETDKPYRLLIESLTVGALTLDTKGIIVNCNHRFSKILELSPQKLVGTPLLDLVTDTHAYRLKALLKKAVNKPCKAQLNLCVKKSIKTVIIACNPLKLGKIDGIAATVTDISKIKIAQHQMYEANERYQVLMDNVCNGLLVHDETGIITDVNKQIEEIFGELREKIIGKNILNYIFPDDLYYIKSLIEKLPTKKKFGPYEGRIRNVSGKKIDVEYSTVSIDFEGQKLFITCINDVSERKVLRRQALLNDKLTLVGTLTTEIIHEINNPITWVLSNLNYLSKHINNLKKVSKYSSELENLENILQETLKGTEKIVTIIKNLKSFAHSGDSKNFDFTNIHTVLDEVIEMASPHLKNIAQVKRDYTDKQPSVLISASKLHQVCLNLIVNAAQAFTKRSAENLITIKTSCNDNQVQIEITDNGSGIPDEIIKNIFEPFFTTKPVGIGTGIGLSVCYDIIHRAGGGSIEVNSSVDTGTTFCISLPLVTKSKMIKKTK